MNEKCFTAKEVVATITKFFEDDLGKVGRVIEVTNKGNGDGWNARVEALEESAYMRSMGRGDMLGVYDVTLDNNLNVMTYSRKKLRERTSLEEE